MKKILALFMFVHLYAFAQNVDLENMSTGKYQYFTAIFDRDDNLYGYFSLYDMGNINDTQKSFEFYVLDKNLNKVLSNRIYITNKIETLVPYINLDNDLILSPRAGYFTISAFKNQPFPKAIKVDLNTNEISQYNTYCFENNEFIDCPENKSFKEEKKAYKNEKKKNEFIENAHVYRMKGGNFLVFSNKDYYKYTKDNEVKFFDEDKNLKWTFKYNEDGSKKKKETLRLLEFDDEKLYTILSEQDLYYTRRFVLIISIKTGEILLKKEITNFSQETISGLLNSHHVSTNENYVLLFNFNRTARNTVGYAVVRIDKNSHEIVEKTISYKPDIKEKLPIIDNIGGVGDGYFLKKKDVFFMSDGSIKILTEKFKPEGQYSRMKTTDMVLISTDSNFNIESVDVMEKEKSKGEYTDYLFSQKINNKKDMVFFYKDFQKDNESKDKNWILFINTIIDGNFSQEQIVISSKQDKFFTAPYVAKEGYILLREFSEKDKHNQIRLERLNY